MREIVTFSHIVLRKSVIFALMSRFSVRNEIKVKSKERNADIHQTELFSYKYEVAVRIVFVSAFH